jgi:hypothetical protein
MPLVTGPEAKTESAREKIACESIGTLLSIEIEKGTNYITQDSCSQIGSLINYGDSVYPIFCPLYINVNLIHCPVNAANCAYVFFEATGVSLPSRLRWRLWRCLMPLRVLELLSYSSPLEATSA